MFHAGARRAFRTRPFNNQGLALSRRLTLTRMFFSICEHSQNSCFRKDNFMKFDITIEALLNQRLEIGSQVLARLLPEAAKIGKPSQAASDIEERGAS